MRALYSLLWWLALPLLPLRLWWRGRREPGYRERIGERFGRYAGPAPSGPVLWLHAVSLGETRAAAPLVRRLLDTYPDATVLVTHMTATGRAAGRELWGERVVQAWLPYDVPFAVRAFLRRFRPVAGPADGNRGVAEPGAPGACSRAFRCTSSTRGYPNARPLGTRGPARCRGQHSADSPGSPRRAPLTRGGSPRWEARRRP